MATTAVLKFTAISAITLFHIMQAFIYDPVPMGRNKCRQKRCYIFPSDLVLARKSFQKALNLPFSRCATKIANLFVGLMMILLQWR